MPTIDADAHVIESERLGTMSKTPNLGRNWQRRTAAEPNIG